MSAVTESVAANWLALAVGAVPILAAIYSDNRSRKRLLEDIAIYEKWAVLDDPASVEACRMSINRKIAKMYLPGVRVSDVIKLIAYVAFLATCVYKVSVSINYKWLWLILAIEYVLLVGGRIRAIVKAVLSREKKVLYSDLAIRLYDEKCLLEDRCLEVLNDAKCNDEIRQEAEDLMRDIKESREEAKKMAEDAEVSDHVELLYSRAKQRNKLRGHKVD